MRLLAKFCSLMCLVPFGVSYRILFHFENPSKQFDFLAHHFDLELREAASDLFSKWKLSETIVFEFLSIHKL